MWAAGAAGRHLREGGGADLWIERYDGESPCAGVLGARIASPSHVDSGSRSYWEKT